MKKKQITTLDELFDRPIGEEELLELKEDRMIKTIIIAFAFVWVTIVTVPFFYREEILLVVNEIIISNILAALSLIMTFYFLVSSKKFTIEVLMGLIIFTICILAPRFNPQVDLKTQITISLVILFTALIYLVYFRKDKVDISFYNGLNARLTSEYPNYSKLSEHQKNVWKRHLASEHGYAIPEIKDDAEQVLVVKNILENK